MVYFPLGSYFVQNLSVKCQRGRIIHGNNEREREREREKMGWEERAEEERERDRERGSDLCRLPSNEAFQQPYRPSYHRVGFYDLCHPPAVIP